MRLISAYDSNDDKAPIGFKSTEYHEYLTAAYGFFNEKLFEPTFGVKLREVIITLTHKSSARAYYWHDIFNDRKEDRQLPELALCYNSLRNDTKTILSSIAHEMTHVLEYMLGTNSPPPYHNKKWSIYMLAIGLVPYSITNPSKMTGPKVSHTIVNGGAFDILADEFIKLHDEFALAQGSPSVVITKEVKKRPFFQCSNCESKLSVPKNLIDNIDIECKTCNSLMVVVQL